MRTTLKIATIVLAAGALACGQTNYCATHGCVVTLDQNVISKGTTGTVMRAEDVSAMGCAFWHYDQIAFRPCGGSGTVGPRAHKPVTLAQVRKAALRIGPERLAPADYIRQAKAVGAQASAEEAEVLSAIHELDLPVYDFARVDDYLDGQAEKQGANTRWVWKPLGSRDLQAIQALPNVSGIGLLSTRIYGRALPIETIAHIGSLIALIPEAVFVVSDYEVLKPDPFLAVSTPTLLQAGKLWIIHQWDEPGFGQPMDTPVKLTANR